MSTDPLGVDLDVAVITPVYRNEDTLPELARRLASALEGRTWRLRMVIDASPDASLAVARALAAADPRIAVSAAPANVGQHRALALGLVAEDGAGAWVCFDADLQDPPEAVPALLDRLAAGDVGAVFAGRRGTYQDPVRTITGRVHRSLMARVTGLPPDAGAFVALAPDARQAILAMGAPSIVAAIGAAGCPVASLPVERHHRPSGRSAWTSGARLRQSGRTLAWAVAARRRTGQPPAVATLSHRCTSVSE